MIYRSFDNVILFLSLTDKVIICVTPLTLNGCGLSTDTIIDVIGNIHMVMFLCK